MLFWGVGVFFKFSFIKVKRGAFFLRAFQVHVISCCALVFWQSKSFISLSAKFQTVAFAPSLAVELGCVVPISVLVFHRCYSMLCNKSKCQKTGAWFVS